MSELSILAVFFLFVLTAVATLGYFLLWRRQTAGDAEETQPGARATAVQLFHTLGQWLPAAPGRDKTRQRLHFAGYRSENALSAYSAARWGVATLLGLTGAIAAVRTQGDASMAFAALVCGFGFGFLLPERFLDVRIKGRNDRLRRSLPPALDLMVMSVEAGQSVDQSILLASRGLRALLPEFAAELSQVHLETRANKSRAEALQHMAERVSEPEIRRFCTLLIESDRFGSSLAPTLRQHAKYLRVRFRQRAQESARKLTVKMVFPIFFLIFPGILVVTLGPAVLTMMKYFRNITQ